MPGPRATVTLSAVKHGETPVLWNQIKEEGEKELGKRVRYKGLPIHCSWRVLNDMS